MRKWAPLVMVVVLGLVNVASANLLLNPSFEAQDVAGSWAPTNWWRSDGNDRTDIGSWGGGWAAQNGSFAMKMNNNGGNPGDHSLGQEVSTLVGVGDQVIFSIYALRNNGPTFDDAYVDLGMMTTGADTWITHLSFASGLSNQTFASGWVQYTFTVTNQTPDVNAIQAWINVKNVNSVGGTDLLFDSASLAIPEPTMAALLGFSGLIFLATRRMRRK
jgi:hypothetical protein